MVAKGARADGEGTMVFKNRDVYHGAWVGEKSQGSGVYQHANGDVFTGMLLLFALN